MKRKLINIVRLSNSQVYDRKVHRDSVYDLVLFTSNAQTHHHHKEISIALNAMFLSGIIQDSFLKVLKFFCNLTRMELRKSLLLFLNLRYIFLLSASSPSPKYQFVYLLPKSSNYYID